MKLIGGKAEIDLLQRDETTPTGTWTLLPRHRRTF
jgi:hypothetical protein